MRSPLHIFWMSLSMLSMGCSMSRFAYTECDTNQQCRDAFGWGHVCNNQFLCAQVKPELRCDTYPTDLLQRQDAFQDAVIVGIQFDESTFRAEKQAAELAILQAMANDGLGGSPYGLVQCTSEENAVYDGLTQDEANLAVSEYLADEIGVVGMIGPATSPQVNTAYLHVEKYGTVMISPSATSPALTPIDGLSSSYDSPGLLWRTVPPDDLQGAVLATYLIEKDIQTVAAIYEEGEYGGPLSSVFMDEFSGSGGQVKPLAYQSDSSQSLQDAFDRVAAQDAVLFVSSTKPDTISFLEEVVDGTFDDKPIFLADGGQDLAIFDAVDGIESRLEQIVGSAPASEGDGYESFAAEYTSKYGEDPKQTPYTGRAYDAAWLLIYGTAWSRHQESMDGAITGLGVARGLRMISDPNGPEIRTGRSDWNLLQAQFEQGNTVNVQGASGPLDFDSETGETTSPIDIWTIVVNGNGDLVVSILKTYDP
jgi:branched-chain amino acid transport system substrate-binding protein